MRPPPDATSHKPFLTIDVPFLRVNNRGRCDVTVIIRVNLRLNPHRLVVMTGDDALESFILASATIGHKERDCAKQERKSYFLPAIHFFPFANFSCSALRSRWYSVLMSTSLREMYAASRPTSSAGNVTLN
jgi:hypothetical protein